MKLFSLASSSKGNCTYISDENDAVLIDAGISVSNMLAVLSLAGLNRDKIRAIFVTHEHTDHINGLKSIGKLLKVPVYGSYGTLKSLLKKGAVDYNTKLYEIDKKTAQIGDISVKAFHTPHDCADSLGYSLESGGKKVSVCTDLGCFPNEGFCELYDSDIILLESNYDKNMLVNGKYPYHLKQRIMSDYGHLSNDDCSDFMEVLIEHNVSRFVLGHLSQNNNLPELALQTVIANLMEKGIKLGRDYTAEVAPVKSHGKYYTV